MKLRSICAGVLGALFACESAFALSCARPDLIKTLEVAKVSPKTYHILVGRFTSLTPEAAFNQKSGQTSLEDQFKPKPPRIMPTHFEGYALTRSQRSDEVLTRFPVDVEISCVASWCSSVPRSGSEVIAFRGEGGVASVTENITMPVYDISGDGGTGSKNTSMFG